MAAAIAGLGLAASGCAQSMSEFAQTADRSPSPAAYPAPGDPQATADARPAVLVDETTVPVSRQSKQGARSSAAPMKISPSEANVASVEPSARETARKDKDDGIAPSANNLNRVPEQPKSKLLSPAEKAKVIAELEALAKKQSADLGNTKKSTACTNEEVDPEQRIAGATGDGGC